MSVDNDMLMLSLMLYGSRHKSDYEPDLVKMGFLKVILQMQ